MYSEQVGLESLVSSWHQQGARSTIAAPKQRRVVTLLCDHWTLEHESRCSVLDTLQRFDRGVQGVQPGASGGTQGRRWPALGPRAVCGFPREEGPDPADVVESKSAGSTSLPRWCWPCSTADGPVPRRGSSRLVMDMPQWPQQWPAGPCEGSLSPARSGAQSREGWASGDAQSSKC